MRIGIIGTGNMGRSLGVAWALGGHTVFFGARDPAKGVQAAGLAGENAQSGTNDEAAEFGEVVLWNPRVTDPLAVLTTPAPLDGKIVIDMHNGVVPSNLQFPPIMEAFATRLAVALPPTRVVKACNTFAQELLEQDAQIIREAGIAAFLAGDDAGAKAVVAELVRELGLDPVDCGPLSSAQMLETMGDLIRLLMISQGRSAFTSFAIRQTPPLLGTRLGGRQPTRLL